MPSNRRSRIRAVTVFALAVSTLFCSGVPGVAVAGPADEPLAVYFARVLPTSAGLVPVYMPAPAGMTPERGALELLIQGPPPDCGLDGLVPAGTGVLSLDVSDDGLATVDFSAELSAAALGSLGEALLVGQIVNTLTALPSVNRVWILVEGRPPGSLGGHVDITEPMSYNAGAILEIGFEDIRGHWAEGYVQAFRLTGTVDGYPDGTFRPEGMITREEFVKLLVLAAGVELSTPESPTFADVEPGRWSGGYIEGGVAAGILRPEDYGVNFGPATRLTRLEMAVLLVRAAGREDIADALTTTRPPYTDIGDLPGWAWGFIGAATELGLMNGYPDGSFAPSGTAKRSEALTVLSRFSGFGEGPIFMVAPLDGAEVGDRVFVIGVGQVFEATVQVRVKDGPQSTFAHVYATATRGAPDYGIFAAILPSPHGPAGSSLIVEAYEISAKDGSEIHLVSRTVARK